MNTLHFALPSVGCKANTTISGVFDSTESVYAPAWQTRRCSACWRGSGNGAKPAGSARRRLPNALDLTINTTKRLRQAGNPGSSSRRSRSWPRVADWSCRNCSPSMTPWPSARIRRQKNPFARQGAGGSISAKTSLRQVSREGRSGWNVFASRSSRLRVRKFPR